MRVLTAGAGVAGLESGLALKALAGERVELTLISPERDFVYRPVSVLEPFVDAPPRKLSLASFVADVGAKHEVGTLERVEPERRLVHVSDGRALSYDALVIASGARLEQIGRGSIQLDISAIGASLHPLVQDIDRGSINSVAFVAPRPTWPLLSYELALLSRARAHERGAELAISVVSEGARPVQELGPAVSDAVAQVLQEAGIDTIGEAGPIDSDAASITTAAGTLAFDRVVAVPRLRGPGIDGLPSDGRGFLPIDLGGALLDVEHVYAAGDASDFPVKFGGVAARQADAVASAIAAAAGAPVEPRSFDGIVHGVLLNPAGRRSVYFSVRFDEGVVCESRVSDSSESAAWAPEAKLDAVYLAAYLDERWADGPPWLSAVPRQ